MIRELKEVFLSSRFDTHGKKYIYLTTGDNEDIDEDQFVDRIAQLIGKDNMLIKVHPSDKRNLYQKKGYCVCEINDVPWEIIWLTTQFENVSMLTLVSDCLINCKVLYEGYSKAIYLYPMIYGKNKAVDDFCDVSVKPLIDFFNRDREEPLIYVSSSMEELSEILNK